MPAQDEVAMKTDELLRLLAGLERKLASVSDQARETREQAQHTLDRLDLVRQELERLRLMLIAKADTGEFDVQKDFGVK